MGQGCARYLRGEDPVEGVLGLTAPLRDALRESWTTVASRQAHYSYNFYLWLLQTSGEVPPGLEQYIGVEVHELENNDELKTRALNFFEEIDKLIQCLAQTKTQQKKVLKRICQSYMYRGQTEEYFQNVVFLLVRYLKEVAGVEPLAELAWIQAVNRVSVCMWEYTQSYHHRREYKRSLAVQLATDTTRHTST